MASSKRKVRCHYEVLEVEQDADDAALKKAYRKKALKYHPDKNPDNVEESTRLFREVQQAYDVLSDPQERAWYDKHRDVILAGGSDEYEEDALDVSQYFSTSAYSGFNDDERGFYTVYAEVFSTLTKEEAPFDSDAEAGDSDNDDDDATAATKYTIGSIPQFGNSTAPYDECVGPFYNHWSNFSTKKSFVWVEKYDTRQAPDRRTRRAMEAENKKLRDEARKRRSDAVRTLVDWMKRRDPRVKARIQRNKELEVERQKRDKDRRREQTKLRNEALDSFKEAEWSSMSGLQDQLDSVEKGILDEFGDSDDDAGAQAIAAAIASATGGADDIDGEMAVNSDDVYEYVQDELYCVACDKSFASQKTLESHQRSKKHKDNVAKLRRELEEDDVDGDMSFADALAQLAMEEEANTEVPGPGSGGGKKSKKAKKKKKRQAAAAAAAESDSDDPAAAAARGEPPATSDSAAAASSESQVADEAAPPTDRTEKECGSSKRKNSTTAASSKSQMSSRTHTEQDLVCAACTEVFSSRNKMFQHLKETGHAQPITPGASSSSSSSKKSKKGKGKKR